MCYDLPRKGAGEMKEQIQEEITRLTPLCEDLQMLDLIHQLLIKSIDNSLCHGELVIRDAV